MKNFLIYLLLLLSFSIHGQKYIKDSVVIHPARHVSLNNKLFQIYNFNDKRDHPGNIFTISEKKQYGLIPVDYLYTFEDSLHKILNQIFADTISNNLKPGYQADIIYFTPGLRKGGILPQYYLNVCISFENKSSHSIEEQKGVLVYETTLPYKSYRKNSDLAYEKLIELWEKELTNDLNTYVSTSSQTHDFLISNLRPADYKFCKNLIMMSSYMAGINWYGLEGEVFFSAPECGHPFTRNTGTVRYINGENYESLFFGKNNENFFWRMNKYALFELQSKILVGINRWKDIETTDHGLEEILQLCYSLSESFQFNLLDKRGPVLSAGLVEDIYYIYNRFDYRIGLKIMLGFKL